METSTLILGGGLSGLALAEALEWRGQDYVLADARDRFGGRILSACCKGAAFDMGPAWFWPGQPRIAALAARLDLLRFEQHANGLQTFENLQGEVQRGRGLASIEGAQRIAGGMSALTTALAQRLPDTRKRLGAKATHIAQWQGKVAVTFAGGQTLSAKRVVLAMPPRMAAALLFTPPLPDHTLAAMAAIPTWMAGQAKAMAIYPSPFWRQAGLSGAAMSRIGPMVEIHDASPADASLGALVGFLGIPVAARHDTGRLRQNVIAQLGRLFGVEATVPLALEVKDWAQDPLTATLADATPPRSHPAYGLPSTMTGLWGNRLILSGSETATRFGGYLEGALEAAETTLETLNPQRR